MRLRDIGNHPGNLDAREPCDVAPVHAELPGQRRQQTQQRLEERGLSAAIGPEQTDDLARAKGQRQRAADPLAAIADGKILRRDPHDQPRRPLASSQTKTGAPTTAVRMPSGTSICATVRAAVSTTSR